MLNYGQAAEGIYSALWGSIGTMDTDIGMAMLVQLVDLEQWYEHDEDTGGIRLSALRNGRTFVTLWQQPEG